MAVWTSPSGSETTTAAQIAFTIGVLVGHSEPRALAAARSPGSASFFVHQTEPIESRSALTKPSRPSHLASALDDSSGASVSSVSSNRCLSGRSTVIRR